jgi:glyoxylase-like metal-dependent hydrolase (beta-lactamase superfamily II)
VVCTHAHNDHINAAADPGIAAHAPVLLHAGYDMLSKSVHADFAYLAVHDTQRIGFTGTELSIIHNPRALPRDRCVYVPEVDSLFSADTLFHGGSGATARTPTSRPSCAPSGNGC